MKLKPSIQKIKSIFTPLEREISMLKKVWPCTKQDLSSSSRKGKMLEVPSLFLVKLEKKQFLTILSPIPDLLS